MGSLFGLLTDPAAGGDPTSAVVRNKFNWLYAVLANLLINAADDADLCSLRDNIGRRPGQVIINAHAQSEPGCLPCDGAAYSRVTYAALYAKVGITWGAGDGVTTFNVPFFDGKTLLFAGTGAGLTPRVVGQSGGYEDAVVVLHSHTTTDPGHEHEIPAGQTGGGTAKPFLIQQSDTPVEVPTDTVQTGIQINNTGVSGVGRNMPPFAVCRAWIKY